MVNSIEEDRNIWEIGQNGAYTVRSSTHFFGPMPDVHVPWKDIWYLPVPLKIQFFMWVAISGNISTNDVLRRKGFILPNICSLCKKDGESVNHILLHCPIYWVVWFGVLRDFGICWALPRDMKTLLVAWQSKAFSCRVNRIQRLVQAAVCRSIWCEKNRRVFKGHAMLSFQVYRNVKDLIFFWAPLCKGCGDLRSGDLRRGWNEVDGCTPIQLGVWAELCSLIPLFFFVLFFRDI